MYTPKHFDEPRVEVLHDLIRSHPLATVVTCTSGGLVANHIPLYLQAQPRLGVLQGHVARANPMWREFLPDIEVLVIFQGAESYITPSWYTTKQETGKVVPTWNYAVVHAYGILRITDDAEWLRTQIEHLTMGQESGRADEWRVTDAPEEYVQKLIGAIVGIEIVVTRLSGKWKMSQNQPVSNQLGVIRGLGEIGTDDALAMANLIPAGKASASMR